MTVDRWDPEFLKQGMRKVGFEPLKTLEENRQFLIDMLDGGFTYSDLGMEPLPEPKLEIDLFPGFLDTKGKDGLKT